MTDSPGKLYLFGMFRSGTTTLARALNTHPAVAFASDPFLDLFKILRSDVAHEHGQAVPASDPLADYYFDPRGVALYRKLQSVSLDRDFPQAQIGYLTDACQRRCESFSPALAESVQDLRGGSYRDLLGALHERIGVVYGDGGASLRYTGFKEVWATEFLPHVLEEPSARAIVMVRDPRAVAASRNVKAEKYPWDFLARQWRKLAGLGWHYSRQRGWDERVKLVRYEDMVTAPTETMKTICAFLELEWEPRMADPAAYDDGAGGTWQQNSTFGGVGAAFESDATERWRTRLPATAIGYLDWLCSPDMHLFGYTSAGEAARRSDDGWMLAPEKIDPADQAAWMRDIVPADSISAYRIAAEERLRKLLVDPARTTREQAFGDMSLLEGAFLEPSLLRAIRNDSSPDA